MSKILVFDTFSGLCNQFYDINYGINFCIVNNFKFTFRHCSFRNKDLSTWYNKNFYELFDTSFLKKHEDLYVEYGNLNITPENTYNYEDTLAIHIFTNNYLDEIKNIDKEFIILKQFWAIHHNSIVCDINPFILPCERINNLYKIQEKIISQPYNFLHYRYESDFTNHFKIQVVDLKTTILDLKYKFKNPELKIYIATSDIENLIDLNDPEIRDIILTKDKNELNNLNFEELAFIDYMVGLNSREVFGHSKSSFSHMLNSLKNTSNFYD